MDKNHWKWLGKERRFRNEDSTYLCIYNRTYKKI